MDPTTDKPQEHTDTLRTVTLVRGSHTWTLRCAPGHEGGLHRALVEHALRAESPISLKDVALIRAQLDGAITVGVNSLGGLTESFPDPLFELGLNQGA